MAMEPKDWISAATGVIGILSAVIAAGRYLVKKEQLDGEMKQLQERYAELNDRHKDLLQVVTNIKNTGTEALVKKSAIDTEVELTMSALETKAASVLVPLPQPNPSNLVFLSVHGPVAAKIRRTTTPISKGIAGYVFSQGKSYLSVDAAADKTFSRTIDKLSDYRTKDVLCVPLVSQGKTIGVLQFLNKAGQEPFTQQDLRVAEHCAGRIAPNVEAFTANPANFELLGFSPETKPEEGTIMFCDLTASSLLLDTMDGATAISLMNAYLESHSDIAMRHGATVDKFLGDGVMLRFNVPHKIDNYVFSAIEAALEMRREFERLKSSWLEAGFPVSAMFTRVGIASGPLAEAIMGHPQYQTLTVMGRPIVIAANLCAGAPRDHSCVVIDQKTLDALNGRLEVRQLDQSVLSKIKGSPVSGYEVIRIKDR